MNVLFLRWWYEEQLLSFYSFFKGLFYYFYDAFSVPICLRTLFSVWRRDEISYHDLSLPEIVQAFSLNFASRLIGFMIKTATLASYLFVNLVSSILFVLFLALWILYPAVIAGLFVWGLILIIGG